MVQTVEERDALCRFHGLDFYVRNHVLNWAVMTRSKVERSIWRQIHWEEKEEVAGLEQALAALRAKTPAAP